MKPVRRFLVDNLIALVEDCKHPAAELVWTVRLEAYPAVTPAKLESRGHEFEF